MAKPALETDIRDAVINLFRQRLVGKKQLFVPELAIGSTRADLAIIAPFRHTLIEIKSGRDTLSRLPSQIPEYELYGDECWIVVHPKHAAKLQISDFWGVIVATNSDNKILLVIKREAGNNEMCPQGRMLRQSGHLWADELRGALKQLGAKGFSKSRKMTGRRALCKNYPNTVLPLVYEVLQARGDWRVCSPQDKKILADLDKRFPHITDAQKKLRAGIRHKLNKSVDESRRTKIQE